ncbi:kynurenine 3-monooxygenase [Ixodes scapularis]
MKGRESPILRWGKMKGAVFSKFTTTRNPDAEAICDLALYNYVEMRDLVNTPVFMLRKKLDTLLNRLAPSLWIPLYTTVTFSRTRYHECVKNRAWQDKLLSRMVSGTLASFGVAALAVGLQYARNF